MKVVIAVFLVLLSLAGCSDFRWLREFELDERTFDSEAMQMISKDTGLVLSDDARGLNFRYCPPIDPAFVARIEMPRESRDQVLKQIEAIQDQDINISGGIGERVEWWPPPKDRVIIDRQGIQSDGDYFRAALTQEDNRIILYVYHAVF